MPFIAAFCGALRLGTRRLHRLLLAALLLAGAWPAHANVVELAQIEVRRSDEGVLLDFAVRFQLPRGIEEALHKGVALHFVAEAKTVRARWYWWDRRVAEAARSWRLTYHPLTLHYRVGLGGLAQNYSTLAEALGSLQGSAGWRIAPPPPADDDGPYYVEFRYRLDTALLPLPLQIGLGGQPDWQLAIERTLAVPAVGR